MATQTITLPAVLVTALQKHYNSAKGGIYNYGPEYDGDGFKFAAWIEVNGNPPGDTHIYCRKVDLAGNEAGRWDFTLPAGWKPDDVSKPTATLQPGHQRAHVVIGGSAHYNYLDPQGNPIARDTVPYECAIPDAWVPRPGAMGVEHDGPGGFIEQNTGGSDLTPEQIQAALRVVLGIPANTNINLASLIQGVIDNIKPKTSAAISESQVLRANSSDAEKFSILRGNNRDGAFQAIEAYFGPKKSASDVVNAAQAVPDTLAEKGKQAQAEEAWNTGQWDKYPKGQAIGTEGGQPKEEGE